MKKILFFISILCTTPLMATKPEFRIECNDFHLTFSDIAFTIPDAINVIDVTTIPLPEFEDILILNAKNKPQPSSCNRTSILTRVEDGKMIVYIPYTWRSNMTHDYIFTIPEGIIVEIKDTAIWLRKHNKSMDLLF
jgi:hypothetical protein